MKKTTVVFILTFVLGFLYYLTNGLAEYKTYTQRDLPIGAKARLGVGKLNGLLTYSADGNHLAVSCPTGIWIFDAHTGAELKLLVMPTDSRVRSLTYSPDGKTLASGNFDGAIYLWDVATAKIEATLKAHTDIVVSLAYSPDGNTLASGNSNETLILWDVATRESKSLVIHHNAIHNLSFNPDGITLASSSYGTIYLWNVATGQLDTTFKVTTGWVRSVAFSPDGNTLTIGFDDGEVGLWDLGTGKNKTILRGHIGGAVSLAFNKDGTLLASGSRGKQGFSSWVDADVHVWDVSTGRVKFTLEGHSDSVRSVAFSPDSNTVASGSDDDSVILWDVTTGKRKSILGNRFQSVAYSPDGRTIAAGSVEGTVRLWDAISGVPKTTLKGHIGRVDSVAFNEKGTLLASGSTGRYHHGGGWSGTKVLLWDVASGALESTLSGHSGRVSSVVFSPDGNTIASGSDDDTVILWNVATGGIITTFSGHTGGVNSVVFNLDGSILASSSGAWSTNPVRLWDVATGEFKVTLTAGGSDKIIFSPDGRTLAGDEKNTVVLWDVATGEQKVTLESPDYLWDIAYSPDGGTLAGALQSEKGMVILWDVLTGQQKATFTGHTDGVTGVAFSQDGGSFVSSSYDGTVMLWDVASLRDTGADSSQVAADANSDGVVNILDLVLVSSRFGESGEIEADVNADGVVNIQDLVLVAAAIGGDAAAPSIDPQSLAMLSAADLQQWLEEARHFVAADAISQRGIAVLEQLLSALMPKETALLANYPNPFNPETWIPYHLAESADVTLTIYAVDGKVVRTLALGHQDAGIYESKSRAAYWDGRNAVGERVASGLYFYMLTAADFAATGKMLIMK